MRKRLLRIILPFFLVFSGAVVFFLFTDTGLLQIRSIVNSFASPMLSIGSVQGKLAGNWSAEDVEMKLPAFSLFLKKIDCQWSPLGLLTGKLALANVSVDEGWLTVIERGEQDSSPEDVAVELPALFLPFRLVVEKLEVNNFRVVEEDGKNIFFTEHMGLAFDWRGGLMNVKELNFRGEGVELSLHGSLEPGPEWEVNILGEYGFAAAGYSRFAGTFSLEGPLGDLQLHLAMKEPALIEAGGRLTGLPDKALCRMKVRGTAVDFSRFQREWPKIILDHADIELSATGAGYHGEVAATGGWEKLQHVALKSSLDGDWEGIIFRSLTLEMEKQRVHVKGGGISWKDIFDWRGQFTFDRFNLDIIPGPVSGIIDAVIKSRGRVVENGVRADFTISSLGGVVEEQHVAANGEIFLTEDRVYTDSLHIKDDTGAGEFFVHHGELSWKKENLTWFGDVSFENIDPSSYPVLHEFNGSLNGHLVVEGTGGDGDLSGKLSILDLGGTMLEQPVSGAGEIRFENGMFRTDGLVVRQGRAFFEVKGAAGDDLGLNFSATVPDASRILPSLAGIFSLRGTLVGNLVDPDLQAELHGEKIGLAGKKMNELDISFDGRPFSGEKIDANVHFDGARIADIDVERGNVTISGSLEHHNIELQLTGEDMELHLEADGGIVEKNWQGTLWDGQFSNAVYTWEQVEKASFSLGKSETALLGFCFTDKEGHLCLDGRLRKKEGAVTWWLKAALENIDLGWLNRYHLLTLPVAGALSGNLEAEGNEKEVKSGYILLNSPGIDFDFARIDEEVEHLKLDQASLTGRLQGGMLSVDLLSSMTNGSSMHLSASLENMGGFQPVPGEISLTGRMEVDSFDLGFAGAMTGFYVEPAGRLAGAFDFSGTLAQPVIEGKMTMGAEGVVLPNQGVTLKDVALSLSGEKDGLLFRVSAVSGKGQLEGTGRVRYGDGPVAANLDVKGENFLLFSLPEYEIEVSPDVNLFFSEDRGEIRGTVRIPRALITPEEMTSSVSVSNDVVLLNGHEESEDTKWPFFTNLNVFLGDEVEIDGYGLKGRLTGKLLVQDRPDSLLTAVGELDLVDGTFTIFGRSLDLKRGRVLFTGGPIDNPGIDVRAQKAVSAEEARGDGYVVGVDVSGMVQDLQFHLFSDPFMEDTEILSQLIVGHSLAGSSTEEGNLLGAAAEALGLKGGNTLISNLTDILSVDDLHLEGSRAREDVSLVVGKRLSKDLYLGYDINMFNQSGVFRVRYDLKHGFSIETRTSPESTGADLIYIFER
ncbi:translocation/assembly module TamB domain-containing protein [Desulfomarina sp.]